MEIIVYIHIITLLITASFILKSDHYGFMWMRGKLATLDATIVTRWHNYISLGLIGMLVSGFLLFYPRREFIFSGDDWFLRKMVFVFALVINSFFIHVLLRIATSKKFTDTNRSERIFMFTSGAVSTISWIGATLCALFL